MIHKIGVLGAQATLQAGIDYIGLSDPSPPSTPII